ncbi:MAG: hypothetical protein ACK5V4_07465 [Alphaproteobacteria bacterium]
MNIIELYYQLALVATNTPFIILISIYILFCVDKNVVVNTLISSMLSIFINQYLKSIWQVPMDPSLHKIGWAFPSGHTQLNIVFWGSLLWQIRSKLLVAWVILLLHSSYFAMVDAKYHTWYDIWGGIIAGVCVLLLFVVWHRYFRDYRKSISAFVLILCALIFLLLPEMPHKFFWLWFYLGCLTPILLVIWVRQLDIDFMYCKLERFGLFIISSIAVFMINLYYVVDPILIFMKGFCIAFNVFFLVPFLYNNIKARWIK